MGVINRSPNSFYAPSQDLSAAMQTVERMVAAGASIIDIGGEATNPNVDIKREAPSIQQEIDRVVPLVAAIKQQCDVLVSVDTSQAKVMREAVYYGADMINDQRALCDDEALQTVAELNVPVCLMHFFSEPREPNSSRLPQLLAQIKRELTASIQRCVAQGIHRDHIIIDPGFGGGNFGKNSRENYYLLAHLKEFVQLGYPVLVGWSRKSMIGDALGGVPPQQRLYGSIAAATMAAMMGASIIRVHDVKETMDAVRVFEQFNIFMEQ